MEPKHHDVEVGFGVEAHQPIPAEEHQSKVESLAVDVRRLAKSLRQYSHRVGGISSQVEQRWAEDFLYKLLRLIEEYELGCTCECKCGEE